VDNLAFVVTDKNNNVVPQRAEGERKDKSLRLVIPPHFVFKKTYNISLSYWFFIDPRNTDFFIPGIYSFRMKFIKTNTIELNINTDWYEKTK
jgi:hypothetical protein